MNPLSMLFVAGVAFRNVLYDRGVFKAHRLARPVISIGNISVGGSGKTPFVIALGELLKERGISFDVLSRGYGRTSTLTKVVNAGGSPAQFGDEPLLIARKLQVPVVVGADRYQAGLLAERKFSSQLHLLDDGFQHRRLHRDFDLVLLPRDDVSARLLPAGRLREPLSALRRADAVVLFDPMDLPVNAQILKAERVVRLNGTGGKAFVFCGIARPRQFFEAMKSLGVAIAGQFAFGDHIRYRQADVDELLRAKQRTGADFFLTTEKDLINLGPLAAQLQPLHTAELQIKLEAPEQALALILETIERRSGCKV
ncbi:MAG TPA: tetraacyldisaccharide 4'-kinase [Candidatus Angelobacter sp.]|nr:tetraacyldisaccharide 4'-kinase [Candidatus Angelobacter sp.]